MTPTVPIPLETRRAVGTLTAEVETVRCALGGGWTTPAAVEAPDCAAVILGRVEGVRVKSPSRTRLSSQRPSALK